VRGGLVRRRCQRVDDVLRRPDLRIPASKINERLTVERGVLGNASEKRREVLLREPVNPVRSCSHWSIVLPDRLTLAAPGTFLGDT
jgi:hypothetical protein